MMGDMSPVNRLWVICHLCYHLVVDVRFWRWAV